MRQKVILGGYECWVDKDMCMIYDTQTAKFGCGFIFNGYQVYSHHLTPEERQQLADFMTAH